MFYLILYTVFIMAVGFALGFITKERLDNEALKEAAEEATKLYNENWELRKRDHVEIINISDKHVEPTSYFEPF